MIKSPLRYPGGKTRAIKYILPLIPDYNEFREPFVGGGSVFTRLKQSFIESKYWINDLNYDLYLFWKYAQKDNDRLVEKIKEIKNSTKNGKSLFKFYQKEQNFNNEFDKAVRFFILNRITFSGTTDSGGYSQQAFDKRFTNSSIWRVKRLKELLINTKITGIDYEGVVNAKGSGVFIFLDPPYYSTANSKLYGKNGSLHSNFDHFRLSCVMKKCNHKWLMTYDDCEKIRSLYEYAEILPLSLQYGMNNKKGKEIFIKNY